MYPDRLEQNTKLKLRRNICLGEFLSEQVSNIHITSIHLFKKGYIHLHQPVPNCLNARLARLSHIIIPTSLPTSTPRSFEFPIPCSSLHQLGVYSLLSNGSMPRRRVRVRVRQGLHGLRRHMLMLERVYRLHLLLHRRHRSHLRRHLSLARTRLRHGCHLGHWRHGLGSH